MPGHETTLAVRYPGQGQLSNIRAESRSQVDLANSHGTTPMGPVPWDQSRGTKWESHLVPRECQEAGVKCHSGPAGAWRDSHGTVNNANIQKPVICISYAEIPCIFGYFAYGER